VRHYGRRGGNGLRGLADLLASMPEGVSELDNAARIGCDLARTITTAMVNDPLFGGKATPLDPGLLLTPATGKRARAPRLGGEPRWSEPAGQEFVTVQRTSAHRRGHAQLGHQRGQVDEAPVLREPAVAYARGVHDLDGHLAARGRHA